MLIGLLARDSTTYISRKNWHIDFKLLPSSYMESYMLKAHNDSQLSVGSKHWMEQIDCAEAGRLRKSQSSSLLHHASLMLWFIHRDSGTMPSRKVKLLNGLIRSAHMERWAPWEYHYGNENHSDVHTLTQTYWIKQRRHGKLLSLSIESEILCELQKECSSGTTALFYTGKAMADNSSQALVPLLTSIGPQMYVLFCSQHTCCCRRFISSFGTKVAILHSSQYI